RAESTKVGRRYARLNDGDRIVFATVLQGDEKSIFLASAGGHVIHFPVEEINILSGVGKGVIGIKLDDDDTCLGAGLISPRNDRLAMETSAGKTLDLRADKYETVSRAGKGFEAVKRSTFVRVVPPPIALVDWEQMEENGKEGNGNRRQRRLFE